MSRARGHPSPMSGTRARGEVAMDASRIETMRGMIGFLIASGARIEETRLCQCDYRHSLYQEIQLLRVFRRESLRVVRALDPSAASEKAEPVATDGLSSTWRQAALGPSETGRERKRTPPGGTG